MAEVAKSGTPSLSSLTPPQNDQIVGLLAGEDIAAWDACYIRADGKVARSTGAAAGAAAAQVDGFAPMATKSGEACTLYASEVNVRYGTGLAPGTNLFLSGVTAGGLADAASLGGTGKIGRVIDATRVRLRPSNY